MSNKLWTNVATQKEETVICVQMNGMMTNMVFHGPGNENMTPLICLLTAVCSPAVSAIIGV